jgi:hypothetical protein
VSPQDGESVSTTPTLIWNLSPGALWHTLQASTSRYFITNILNETARTDTSFQLAGLLPDTVYYWRVSFTDSSGTSTWSDTWSFRTTHPTGFEQGSEFPYDFGMSQTYPNPFNGISNFEFRILKSSDVSLIIYDLLGRQVASLVDEELSPGNYTRQWDATGQPSGVYFYRLLAGHFSETGKVLLLK